ncbi:MAG: DHHA1 domain-containing protein, partial [Desulfovibrionaceae bacterium]|nr:DHHA1 domain-containing protein [Desulfovibrionaceae bacterium]
VADVVELTGQNRILVKNGLLLLKDAERPGIAALKEVCGLERFAPLSAGRIGFGLAPRLNAAGRMGDPDRALDLLLARDLETARPIAARLDRVNAERRREEQAILEQAMAQAESQAGRMGLVLFGPDWHPGIIGIVASRVVERFYRPTIMLCAEDGRLKGSGRSVEEFDLYSGLAELEGLLLGFGGHRQAAGLSLEPENLEALREGFHRVVARALGGDPLSPTLKLDSRLGFKEIDQGLLKELEALQPFGVGNPEPVFLSPPVVVRDYSVFGQDHVRLVLADEQAGAVLTGKAWRMAASLPPEVLGRSMSFAYTPKLDTFRGAPRIELSIKDWERPGQGRVNMSAL